MIIGTQFEKEREKLEQDEHFGQVLKKYLPESKKKNIRARKVYPERTVGTLYPPVSPSYPTGADRAGI